MKTARLDVLERWRRRSPDVVPTPEPPTTAVIILDILEQNGEGASRAADLVREFIGDEPEERHVLAAAQTGRLAVVLSIGPKHRKGS